METYETDFEDNSDSKDRLQLAFYTILNNSENVTYEDLVSVIINSKLIFFHLDIKPNERVVALKDVLNDHKKIYEWSCVPRNTQYKVEKRLRFLGGYEIKRRQKKFNNKKNKNKNNRYSQIRAAINKTLNDKVLIKITGHRKMDCQNNYDINMAMSMPMPVETAAAGGSKKKKTQSKKNQSKKNQKKIPVKKNQTKKTQVKKSTGGSKKKKTAVKKTAVKKTAVKKKTQVKKKTAVKKKTQVKKKSQVKRRKTKN